MSSEAGRILRPLKLRTLWLAGGAILLGVVLAMALLPGESLPSIRVWDKALHSLTFTCLMLWFSGLVHFRRVWLVAFGLFVYGALIELLQGATGYRHAELGDLVANAVGIGFGWLLALAGLYRWPDWCEQLLGIRTR